ncbi:hypothetical protein BKI52_39090 [marine bacterium AO1-C]|nr:hypothetical protein BKI52_39090 [marine bacterium AO1-C]
MQLINNKWMIALTFLVLVLVVLYFTGRKSVHHEIVINASAQKVWEVLINTSEYDSWNPVMRLVEGEVKEGSRVKYRFTQAKDRVSEIPAKVKKIIPQRLLNQAGGLPFILTFDHRYELISMGNKTKVVIHEDYAGIGVNFWSPQPVEAAYARLNQALKKKVESN